MRRVRLYVQSAKGLERGVFRLPAPFALVAVDGNQVLATRVIENDFNPYWNEICDIDMSPEAVITVEVRDKRKESKKDHTRGSLGVIVFRLGDVLNITDESSPRILARALSPKYEGHHVRGTVTVVLHMSRSEFASSRTTPAMPGSATGLPDAPSPFNRSYASLPSGTSPPQHGVRHLELSIPSGEGPSRAENSPINQSPMSNSSHGSWPGNTSSHPGASPASVHARHRTGSSIEAHSPFDETFFPSSDDGTSTTAHNVPGALNVYVTPPSTLALHHEPPPYSVYPPTGGETPHIRSRSTGDLDTLVPHAPPLETSRAHMPGTDLGALESVPQALASGIRAGTRLAVHDFNGHPLADVEVLSSDIHAHGAFAHILRGQLHDERGTIVALKVFKALLSREEDEMLRRELSTCSRLNNERILHFIGTTVIGYHTVLVSEFMKNGNLDAYLKINPRADRTRLVYQVAEAVAFLHHQAKHVHGDLKCQNVLVNDNGDAVLADFGLSTTIDKPESEDTTMTGIMHLHTLHFAAPEILMGNEERLAPLSPGNRPRSKTRKSDVYAFGSLLLQAYIGELPWKGVSQIGIITSVTTGTKPPRPNPEVFQRTGFTERHWNICIECWSFDPGARPTMQQVQSSLSVLRYRE